MTRKSASDDRVEAIVRLVASAHEGIFVGTVFSGASAARDITVVANPHLRTIFGFPPNTPDAAVTAFAPERFVDTEAREALCDRLREGVALVNHFLRMRRLDGSPVWVEVTASGTPTDGAGIVLEALVRDVSARKHLENRSRDIYQQILQSEKMAALGQTVSGVAHELNNPLATIVSWAERLSERPLDELARRGVGVIHSEAERAARIVRNLLNASRTRHTTRSVESVNRIVRETLALRAYDPDGAIRAVVDLDESLPPVLVDAHQIQQIVLNLLMNAEQAMLAAHGGGVVTLRTRPGSRDRTVLLEVSDDGPGVPSEFQTRIFDPFFTTKEAGQGTGLGLAVVQAIVQEHGGSIRVTTAKGGGALFQVELPGSGASAAGIAPSPVAQVRTSAKVLVVEGDSHIAKEIIDTLSRDSLAIDSASDGQEALARIRRNSYDLVVCNLKISKVDGRTLYRAITATTPALARRVIFVTTGVAGTDTARFLDETGCPWVSIPFRPDDLLRAVTAALA